MATALGLYNGGPLVGQRFGRLRVVASTRSPSGRAMWLCACDCGGTTRTSANHLNSGHTRSCGCVRAETRATLSTRHGHSRPGRVTPEYGVWKAMVQRCTDKNSKSYARYGGRGVAVCDKWRNDFSAFFAEVGQRPSPTHSLERMKNDSGYEPGNVRWATRQEQARNKRTTAWVTWAGREMSLADACDDARMPYHVVWQRLERLHWPFEKAMTAPVRGA